MSSSRPSNCYTGHVTGNLKTMLVIDSKKSEKLDFHVQFLHIVCIEGLSET